MRKVFLLIVTTIYFSHLNAQIPYWLPTNGLAAWYPFNGNANDSSGNINHGVNIGATLTADKNNAPNSAYKFDGVDDHINIASSVSLDIRGSVSVCAWVKFSPSFDITQNSQIFWRGDNQVAKDPYSFWVKNGYIWRRDSPTPTFITFSPSGGFDTIFHHIAGIYDSLASKYYIAFDGALVDSLSSTATINYSTSQMWNDIGSVGNDQYFKGTIDNIAVYNRAISFCEMKDIYYENKAQIITQPQNQVSVVGSSAQFSISTHPGVLYQWQVDAGTGFTNLTNSGPYTGTTTNTLTISNVSTMMNNYSYRCILKSGPTACEVTSNTCILTVIVGVKDVSGKSPISVYPNPIDNDFILKVPRELIGTYYEVTDNIGRKVLSGIIEKEEKIMSVRELAIGTYILNLEGPNPDIKIYKK